MTKDLLWEIGLEEIPARFLPPVIKQMEQLAKDAFAEAGLIYQNLDIYATPRRLTLLVEALAEKADDQTIEVKGPAKAAAFNEQGEPTKALAGFCRGQVIDPAELIEKELNNNVYMYAVKKSIGKQARQMLPEILTNIGNKLYFPKPMRWGYNPMRFARPVRWLVALFGSEIIDIEFGGIAADCVSRGHRLLGSDQIRISEPARYKEALKDNYVIVDQEERRELCRQQINAVAAAFGGHVEEDEELLSEVTYLLEYPTALSGYFEDKYLAIPEELVTTPMVDQQRYFPVYDSQNKLLPRFITVRNGDDRFLGIVAEGNEKVLRARLADAEFFYNEDLKDKMDDKVEAQSAVVFHEKLGSVRQKVARMIKLAEFIAQKLSLSQEDIDKTLRGAYLAKADLGSRVVYEFPELQGIIGEYYALAAGEDEAVAIAIREHYLPRFSGDELPLSKQGYIIALADRLDSMAGFFAMDMIPTGSQDPYALRRAATGCVQIIINHQLDLRMDEILPYAFELLKNDAPSLEEGAFAEQMANLITFMVQRVETALADDSITYDVINAVRETNAAAKGDIIGLVQRATALQDYRDKDEFPVMLEAINRVGNILRSAADKADIGKLQLDASLLVNSSEKDLLSQIEIMEKAAQPALAVADYQAVFAALYNLAAYINAFFEAVMVMDQDSKIRDNRLALLQRIIVVCEEICDLSKIVS